MADKRINALANTAPNTASDDFFAVDGTTNGTRKLNAFSPTFGGNATVTGTLTGNSTITGANLISSVNSGAANGSEFTAFSALVGTDASLGPCRINIGALPSATFGSRYGYIACYDSGDYRKLYLGGSPGIAATGGQILIPATIASTTTSTGALVVGNGTSGGLGVGGAIVAGGTITSTASTDSGLLQLNLVNSSTGTSASSLFRFNAGTRTATLQAYNDTHATLAGQLRVGTSNGDIVVIPSGVAAATFGASSISLGALNSATTIIGGDTGSGTNILLLKDGLGTLKVNFKGNGDIAVLSSTASTSTSSGALVVSGGVGVAKRIHSGEGLTTGGDNETQISFVRNGTISIGPTSAATPKLAVGGGLQLSNTSQSISAWGDIGPQLSIAGAVVTDTTSSGTVSRAVANSINATAFAASSSTTYTQAVSLFIADAPTANTNVTISHRYALYTAGGRINFQGLPTSSAGLQAGTLWNDAGTLKVA